MKVMNSIAAWPKDDRPREKLVAKGKTVLSDAELLAIILGTGSGEKSAVDLARELLQLVNGDLHTFGRLQLHDLKKIKGVGEAKAVAVLAALELGRRRQHNPMEKRMRISSSMQLYEILKPYFADLNHEEFYVMLLNRNNNVIGARRVSVGGMSGAYVDSKIIYKIAIEMQASAIILAHNHPSGNIFPSEQDEQLTRRIKQFGSLIDMPVLDHIIITDNGYFSFADNGKI
jgi:DNA repair protein RadC